MFPSRKSLRRDSRSSSIDFTFYIMSLPPFVLRLLFKNVSSPGQYSWLEEHALTHFCLAHTLHELVVVKHRFHFRRTAALARCFVSQLITVIACVLYLTRVDTATKNGCRCHDATSVVRAMLDQYAASHPPPRTA